MDKGTRFVPARNPSQNTEEIFFCIQSGTMDIPLFVDTAYPAYHIHGEKDLEGALDLSLIHISSSIRVIIRIIFYLRKK